MSRRSTLQKIKNQETNFQISTNKKQRTYDQTHEMHKGSFSKLPGTQRKTQQYDINTKNYMDRMATPLKYELNNLSPSILNPQMTETAKYRQVLLKLDQAQQKLVISQKKYGQLWRKYQATSEGNSNLNKQITKLLAKPIDLQSKLALQKRQNIQSQEKLYMKDRQVQTLKNNINNTNNKFKKLYDKVQQFEYQIQKLVSQNKQKSLIIQKLRDQLSIGKEQKSRSYERIINTLKHQVQSLHNQLTRRSQEIGSLQKAVQICTLSSYPQQQSSSLQTQLNRLHKQKLNLIQTYEQKISYMEKKHEQQVKKLNNAIKNEMETQLRKIVDIKLQKQEHEAEITVQISKLKQTVQHLKLDNNELQMQVSNLKVIKSQLQEQLNLFLAQIYESQRATRPNKQQKDEFQELFYQLQSIKTQLCSLHRQLRVKQQQVQQQRMSKDQLVGQVVRFQQQIKQRDNQELQQSKKTKERNQFWLDKIELLQGQNQQMQRQLLAERLQSAKLRQQLSEQSQFMKRQYQLSLQNVKAQLSKRIRETREEKDVQTLQKQQVYFQFRQLERKYQLLVSEMLTVDDMMSIATKVHKRHSTYVKR